MQAMASPNFILPPGVTLPASLVPTSMPPSTLTDIDDFLKSQNRCTQDVLPDGNCMFRALSHQLYGNDEHHIQLRTTLLEAIQSNYSFYQPLWIEEMPWGKVTFDEHLENLARVGTWGTHVELQTVSNCFNTKVFVCSPNPAGIIRWEKKGAPIQNFNPFAAAMGFRPTFPFTQCHIELSYCKKHYRSVLPTEKGVKLSSPVIIQRQSDFIRVSD